MTKVMYNWLGKYMFWQNAFNFPFSDSMPTPDPPNHTVQAGTALFIGHRGSMVNYPENTMLSTRKAVEEGANGVEVDVRATQDEVFAIMHDGTVDRTTDGTGEFRYLDWSYVSTLDAGSWKGAEFANREDTKIPTLDEFLEEFKGQPVFLSLHLKLYSTQHAYDIVEIVKAKGMMGQVIFFGWKGLIDNIMTYDNSCFVMNDGYEVHSNFNEMLNQAIENDWSAMSIYVPEITQDMLDQVNENGMYTHASAVSSNFAVVTQDMIDFGVNFVLGDDCDAMMQVANQNNITQIFPGDL